MDDFCEYLEKRIAWLGDEIKRGGGAELITRREECRFLYEQIIRKKFLNKETSDRHYVETFLLEKGWVKEGPYWRFEDSGHMDLWDAQRFDRWYGK